MPGIREAIEQRNWKEAQEQIQQMRKLLIGYQIILMQLPLRILKSSTVLTNNSSTTTTFITFIKYNFFLLFSSFSCKLHTLMRFQLNSSYKPAGDQPQAIEQLTRGNSGRRKIPDIVRRYRQW